LAGDRQQRFQEFTSIAKGLTIGALAVCVAIVPALTACSPRGGGKGQPPLNEDKIEAAINRTMGGGETCVALADTATGRVLYQYGNAGVCMRGLPPCATFEIANDLIGLDLGLIQPGAVVKWDGTPQPVRAWEADADMAKAFKDATPWWDQRLAVLVGHDRYVERLKALDYGTRDPTGPVRSFWMGSSVGGGLWISTLQQAGFLKRLYDGQLPVKSAAATEVGRLLIDDTRTDTKGGRYVMSGKGGACASVSDNSRQVGWWIGRLQAPTRDLVFAASIEAAGAPPGNELGDRIKEVFVDGGLWPPER
jgi:beta-lactamase class D